MAEAATIDAPATGDDSAPEVRGKGFNTMVEQLEKGIAEVRKQSEQPTPPDTRPVEQPTVKREPKPGEKPPEPPKPVVDTKDAKEPDTFVSPSAANFKKVTADRDSWKQKAAEHEAAVKAHAEKMAALEKEYTEFKTKTTIDPKEIESLKKEREEYASKLERVALAETPKFRDYYNAKFEQAVTQALDAAGKEKADQVRALMEAPKSAWRKGVLNEIIESMESKVDQMNLLDAVNKYDATRAEREKELENHKAALRELRAVEERQTQEKQERENMNRKAFVADVLKKAEVFDAFKSKDDDAEHNAQVAKNRKTVEDFIFGTLDVNLVGMLPVLAAQGEHLQKVVKAKDAKIGELEEALKKYQGAQPSLEGGGQPPDSKPAKKSYTEEVMDRLRGVNQR